ncbi:MAG TPA: ATP-binding protein [Geminicoccus sp.]|jgi:signal transduction histidine kinase/DNA-binding NarL/FixJ family response regulator|uniref:ATP-binding protein n=1 Tax=Geminicoccus sp. TaxID=2024832 RepID=UPI002E34503D|nr:ATP-binding protein [Geminicoccus sp.]HEX2525342.1 ATP-binding protein [Geminicoccus sp.]
MGVDVRGDRLTDKPQDLSWRDRFASLRPGIVGAAAALVIVIVFGAGASWFLWRDRSEVLAGTRAELTSSATAGAGMVERGVGTIDIVVSLAIDEFASGQMGLEDLKAWLLRQSSYSNALSSLSSLFLADAQGIVTFSGSNPAVIGLNASDRDYFTVHRNASGARGIFIDAPLIGRVKPHRRFVPMTWPLRTSADGRFAGIVGVVAHSESYADVFSILLTQPDQIMVLIDPLGRIYAMDSLHWPSLDREPPRPDFLLAPSDQRGSNSGMFRSDDYLVARTEVRGLGLQVATAVPVVSVLKAWWVRTWIAAVLIGLAGLGTGVLAGLLHRYVRELRRAATAAQVAQARAEAGDRAKAQFLAAMSHEIRTPMTGVLGMADLLAAERLKPRQQAYLQAIRTSGRHLLSVINDVLDFSRFNAGGLVLEDIDFSVAQIGEQTRSILAPTARDKGLRLTFDLSPDLPVTLRGDPTRLRQILVNLVGNALKFTSEGGVDVRIFAKDMNDEQVLCRFEVEDTGIGIPSDRLDDLFQAFTQADLSTTRKYGGSGLGLAICRQLVHAMGGKIGVKSDVGQGSLFWFEVPLDHARAEPIPHSVTWQEVASRPLRILVAEDVEINRDLIQAALGRDGHELVLVENGQEAVRMAGQEQFDVILMDVQMPVMDGIEATRRIRALPPPRNAVPILALTANVMEAERKRCREAGMNEVFTKPVVWPELFAALGAISQGKPSGSRQACQEQVELALLDEERIGSLGSMAGPAKLAEFLSNAMMSAEQLHGEIMEAGPEPAAVAKLAHRLAGTAPSFGLTRIGTIAREVEQRALIGEHDAALIGNLGIAVAETRQELVRRELVAAT